MIKAEIEKGSKFILQASGNIIIISAEVLMLIDKIYESFADPKAAEIFKKGIQDAVMYGPVLGNDPEAAKEHINGKKIGGPIFGEEW